jgi:hypothetical protein
MELEPEIIRPGENSYPSENPNDEPDLLPEYSHYPDEGCEFAHLLNVHINTVRRCSNSGILRAY